MMHDTQENPAIEHAELIDMRTHLTVAMLAAAQLNRRTKDLPEAAHLQSYLDQSLKSLVEDIGKVDALVATVEESMPTVLDRPHRRGLLWPVRWIRDIAKHGVHAICSRLHHNHYTRMVAPSLYR